LQSKEFGFNILNERNKDTLSNNNEESGYTVDAQIMQSILEYSIDFGIVKYFKSRDLSKDHLLVKCKHYIEYYRNSKINKRNRPENMNPKVVELLEKLKYLELVEAIPSESKNHELTENYKFTKLGRMIALLLLFEKINQIDRGLAHKTFNQIYDFYNSFNTTATPTTYSHNDTLIITDKRLGGRVSSNPLSVSKSGIRPGFLIDQQYNENGVALKDRKGFPLSYTAAIAPNMIESGSNLEVTGIRVVKYVPDYAFYGGPAGNDFMIFRYPDVVLMVAEAKLRLDANDGSALTMVNDLRTARGAPALASLPLVNTSNVEDPGTLLAERGRELYWESSRRSDLLRFGVYLKTWQYKPTDDPKNLLFPVPNQALAANPNLKQNPGY